MISQLFLTVLLLTTTEILSLPLNATTSTTTDGAAVVVNEFVDWDYLSGYPEAAAMHQLHLKEGFHWVEGDMIVKDEDLDRNGVTDVNKLWPQGVVPFVIDISVRPYMREKIQQAMADFAKYTCIKFTKWRGEKDYVFINSRTPGCYAHKGRSGGQQPLNLQDPGCEAKGTIIHEMLHTVGFAHEQSRGDRDKYIMINWHNIESDKWDQFAKLEAYEEDNQGFRYDFSSVMHYGPMGFSKNGRPAITTRDPLNQDKIGQRAGFSKQDVAEVNKIYKC